MTATFLNICYFTCLMGLICALIIILRNKFHIYYKLLILTCLFLCIVGIGCWTFFQDQIPLKEYSYLWVMGFPVGFVPGCLVYLYIKSIITKKKRINKLDYLHLLPALLQTLEIIPYFLLPVPARRAALTAYLMYPQTITKNSVFLMTMNMHVLLKAIIWFIYIVFTVLTLIKFSFKNPFWIIRNNHIWFWLTRLTALHLISFLILLTCIIFFSYPPRDNMVVPNVFFTLSCVLLLLFNPKILYGLDHLYVANTDIQLKEEEAIVARCFELPTEKTIAYREKIQLLIDEERVYLNKNYLLKDMASELNIPLHHLSYVINKEFNINFTSFINYCRIQYIIKHRNDPRFSRYSLEGMCDEAGFNSRNAFFKAFKMVTGVTPSEYFKNN